MNTFPAAPKQPCSVDAPIYAARLPELRAGTLSQPEQEALRSHLLICAPCREQAARAADEVVEGAVRRHYSASADGAPFLALDDIRRRTATQGADEVISALRAGTQLHDGEEMMTSEDRQTQADTPTLDGPTRPTFKMPNRWRNVAAVVATVVLISLFALLLRGLAEGKSPSGPADASVTATPSGAATTGTPGEQQTIPATRGQWHTVDSMTYTTTVFTQTPYPKFSPVNPAIVYETSLPSMTVRRSDNGGATWATLQLPPGSSQAIDIEIFASPLDAHTAFLTVTVNLAYGQGTNSCPSSAQASLGGATHGNILASGQVPCSTTYRTIDEGKTWKAIRFPVNGTISTPFSDSAPYDGTLIQAQGKRLYTLLTCGPTCGGPAGRLVSSADGGATWQVADAGGLGQGICDFAVPPTGQTVFAAVSRGSCDALSSPALALDRSDDAGANWVHASFLPLAAVQGMAAVVVNGKALLVVNVPSVSWQPHIIAVAPSASEFIVSSDGGRTWKTAPLQGVPDKAQPVLAPLNIRADGSLVVAFASPNADGQAATLYTWKAGESRWQQFAPAPAGHLSTLLRTSASSGEIFWAVTKSNVTPSGMLTFTVATYQP